MGSDSAKEQMAKKIINAIREEEPQTVKQLVDFLQEESKIPKEKIIEFVLSLRREGKINLIEPSIIIPERLGGYLKTGRARWFWVTITLAAASTLVIFTLPEQLFPLIYIRYLLGTIYVLWLPGYTLIKALFPQTILKSAKGPDSIERTALSIGLSIALVPLIGLLLNYTPWGIRLTPIVLSLLILIIIFSTTAVIREHQTNIKQNKPSRIK